MVKAIRIWGNTLGFLIIQKLCGNSAVFQSRRPRSWGPIRLLVMILSQRFAIWNFRFFICKKVAWTKICKLSECGIYKIILGCKLQSHRFDKSQIYHLLIKNVHLRIKIYHLSFTHKEHSVPQLEEHSVQWHVIPTPIKRCKTSHCGVKCELMKPR